MLASPMAVGGDARERFSDSQLFKVSYFFFFLPFFPAFIFGGQGGCTPGMWRGIELSPLQ